MASKNPHNVGGRKMIIGQQSPGLLYRDVERHYFISLQDEMIAKHDGRKGRRYIPSWMRWREAPPTPLGVNPVGVLGATSAGLVLPYFFCAATQAVICSACSG